MEVLWLILDSIIYQYKERSLRNYFNLFIVLFMKMNIFNFFIRYKCKSLLNSKFKIEKSIYLVFRSNYVHVKNIFQNFFKKFRYKFGISSISLK